MLDNRSRIYALESWTVEKRRRGWFIKRTHSADELVPLLQPDRRRHLYLCGMTGTGKTGLLQSLMRADFAAGAGFCFLDPHGDASLAIAAATPRVRLAYVIYLDPSDPTHTFAFNPLAGVAAADRATTAANIVSSFSRTRAAVPAQVVAVFGAN